MKKTNETNINEIKKTLLKMFDEKTVEEMIDIYNMEELIDIIEKEEESIIDKDIIEFNKHSPSRKKKSKRIKKSSPTYKKNKSKKWIEKRRTNIPEGETNNRTYINKASKGYTKLHPHVNPKVKKDDKKA